MKTGTHRSPYSLSSLLILIYYYYVNVCCLDNLTIFLVAFCCTHSIGTFCSLFDVPFFSIVVDDCVTVLFDLGSHEIAAAWNFFKCVWLKNFSMQNWVKCMHLGPLLANGLLLLLFFWLLQRFERMGSRQLRAHILFEVTKKKKEKKTAET